MCVETSAGKTSRIKLEELVMQGSVPGGFICSNQLSKICNRLYNEHEVYMYMNTVPVPGLCMVDDLVTITKCQDIKGIVTNVKVDEFVKSKKLECQTGNGKCQWVHIGTKNCKNRYYVNKNATDQAEKYKYLGDIISNDLEQLYQGRVDKANGYRSSCISMVTETSLGHKMFDIAKILHSSIFLNGTMVNMETWPHFTEKRLEYFEKIEQHYFRTLLKAHSKTPIETIYLELGVLPFRFHLIKRRINHFHVILNRDKSEITRQVIEAQRNILLQGDFLSQVFSDLKMLDLNEILIKSISKEKLKKLLQLKIEEKGFQYLISKSIHHSKTRTEIYCDMNGSNYFRDSRFTPDIARTIFKFRTRMVNVKNNFRNKYNQDLKCSLCELEVCDQSHLFRCDKLREAWEDFQEKYDDLFCQDLNKLLAVGKTATKLVLTRDILLEPED